MSLKSFIAKCFVWRNSLTSRLQPNRELILKFLENYRKLLRILTKNGKKSKCREK